MAQFYSDPSRESEPYALPDITVEWLDESPYSDAPFTENEDKGPGWYWAPCFPGCMPDGEWSGPFATVEAAELDMRNTYDD